MSSPPSPPPSPYRERISIFSIILWPTRNPAAQEFLTRTPPQAADADDGFVITSFYLQFLSWEHRHRAWNRTGLVVDAPSRETSSLHLVISIESSLSGSLSFPLSFFLSLSLCLSTARTMVDGSLVSFEGGKSAISRSARSSIKARRCEFSMSASGFSRCLFLFSSPLLFSRIFS